MAAVHGTHPQLLRSVIEINSDQRLRTVSKVRAALEGELERRRVLILGAAFKADTDDLRNSPSLELAKLLQLEGAEVTVYDPIVPADRIERECPQVRVADSVEHGAFGAHAIVLATGWPEFKSIDWGTVAQSMARPVLVDARNYVDGSELQLAGFSYYCIGRPSSESPVQPGAELATLRRAE
jgi:UDPglucose 6-dehydrogenase